jgi:hypothetical protein
VGALLPILSERLGGAPRVADSPALASAFCRDGARLLVYEHGGAEWMPLGPEVRAIPGADVAIVAAVAPENASDVAGISAWVSAVVAWNGDGRRVAEAVGRVLAARKARPAATRGAGPVIASEARAQPPRPAPVVPAAAPRSPPVMAPAVPAVAPAPAQPLRTATVPPPRPSAAPGAALILPWPVPPDVAAPASPTPAPPPPVAPPDLDEITFGTVLEGAEPTGKSPAQPMPVTFAAPSGTWPGTVLSAADGLSIVRRALSGLRPETALRAVTESVVRALSTAEKAAALGHSLPFEASSVRRAVGLRWQVAAAVATLPPVGSPIDGAAVQGILGGIDEVLSELMALADEAAPEALRAIEAVRHDLVREAIDLTEALQQVAPPEVVEELTSSRKARRGKVAVTRIVRPPPEPEEPERRTPWTLVVVLVLAVLGGAAYHGYRYVNRPKPAAPPAGGAPSATVGVVTPQGKVLAAPAGAVVDARELEIFRSLERAKGNEVREILPGTFVVAPAAPPGVGPPAPAPAAPAPATPAPATPAPAKPGPPPAQQGRQP